jgi:hypothetical protein
MPQYGPNVKDINLGTFLGYMNWGRNEGRRLCIRNSEYGKEKIE